MFASIIVICMALIWAACLIMAFAGMNDARKIDELSERIERLE